MLAAHGKKGKSKGLEREVYLLLYHCDQIFSRNKLSGKRFILALYFRGISVSLGRVDGGWSIW